MFCLIQRNEIINLLRKWGHMILLWEGNEWHWVTLAERFFAEQFWLLEPAWNSLWNTQQPTVSSASKCYLSGPRLSHTHLSEAGRGSSEGMLRAGRHSVTFKEDLSIQMFPESINTKVLCACRRNSSVFVFYIFGPLNLEYFVTLHIASFPGGEKKP